MGTSITARSIEYAPEHPNATTRPPLMHGRNTASFLWDAMAWPNQHYRRYDYPGFFTEGAGTWVTDFNVAEWDDNVYRSGMTRYTDSVTASLAFDVPSDAWQFRFIYRTDTTGGEATLAVTEGDDELEAYDDATSSWVEANGYVLSFEEDAPVSRTISVPHPDTGVFSDYSIPSKGNTTYQKRLKLRAKNGAGLDSRGHTKTVTLSKSTAGRMMYWGAEWSTEEFMITYINAARGSHHTRAEGAAGLPRFADNEVWSFEPDLILTELPIHNDGAAGPGTYAGNRWAQCTENWVFNPDYELSIRTRAAYFGLDPEIVLWTSTVSLQAGAVNADGSLIAGLQNDGAYRTAQDKYDQARAYVEANYPDVLCIDATSWYINGARAIYGNLYTALDGTSWVGLVENIRYGPALTADGTHPNKDGCRLMANAILPVLNFDG